jgi:copper chaperone CopZ
MTRRPRRALATAAAVATLMVGLAGCERHGDAPPPAAIATPSTRPPLPAPRPIELTHVTIKALGMTCPESCPLRVRNALAAIPAIYELGFDLDHEAVLISYDAALGPAKQVTAPILAAIKDAGYDPWLAKESWPDGAAAEVMVHARPAGGPPPGQPHPVGQPSSPARGL